MKAVYLIVISMVVVTPQILHAESRAYPCFRFSYSEKVELDTKTLPAGVKIHKKVGSYDGYFLANDSTKPLVTNLGNSLYIKLEGGKHYVARFKGPAPPRSIKNWKEEESDIRVQSNTNIKFLVKEKKIPDIKLYGSNESPPVKPENVQFEIPAYFDGSAVLIKGTLSYEPSEKSCRQ